MDRLEKRIQLAKRTCTEKQAYMIDYYYDEYRDTLGCGNPRRIAYARNEVHAQIDKVLGREPCQVFCLEEARRK